MRILITSGPTRAPLDAVRFLSNRSTGRFGTLLAEEALRNGMGVTMIYGIGSETPQAQARLKLLPIETNQDLEKTLRRELIKTKYDAVIHAMAVLDYRPARVVAGKRGSRDGDWLIRLIPTAKVIRKIKRWAPRTLLIGFKLESSGRPVRELVGRATRLVQESGADYVVANYLSEGSDDQHRGYLVGRDGTVIRKTVGKKNLAREIIRRELSGVWRLP